MSRTHLTLAAVLALLIATPSMAQTACDYSPSPQSANFPWEGATGATFTLTITFNLIQPCTFARALPLERWTVITGVDVGAVQINANSVTFSVAITYTVEPNPGEAREAVINIIGLSGEGSGVRGGFTVTQEANPNSGQPPPTNQRELSINRRGFVFLTQGGTPVSQPLEIVSGGANDGAFNVRASTRSGGDWLSVDPPAGSFTAPGESAIVNVTANSTGIDPGDYYGSVTVTNGPQTAPLSATVVMRVLADDAFLPAEIEPGGLLFVNTPAFTGEGQISFTNPGSTPLMVEATARFDLENGVQPWFTIDPVGGPLAPGETRTVNLQIADDLPPGVFRGEIDVTSARGEQTATRRVGAALVSPSSEAAALGPAQGACAPTELVAIWSRPALDFSVVAGWPTAVETQVVDDCGAALAAGSVTTVFSNGDPELGLSLLRDGRWVGTWTPINVAADLAATVTARNDANPPLETTLVIDGGAPEAAVVPIIPAPPVSAVSFARDDAIGIGAFAALFGTELAGGLTAADSLPLPGELGGTSVFIDGSEIPLLFTSAGQINGVIPLDLAPGSHSLVVLRDASLSTPLEIQVTGAQPALFSVDSSGAGQGLIERVSPDGSRSITQPGTPARPGDVLVIYASGLGAVTGNVNAGDVSPASPLSETIEPVTVSVGGADAPVGFAGLTPGFANLFQINANLPAAASVGDAIEVVVSVGGATSQVVTIAVGSSL